jgi:hypothetical protein
MCWNRIGELRRNDGEQGATCIPSHLAKGRQSSLDQSGLSSGQARPVPSDSQKLEVQAFVLLTKFPPGSGHVSALTAFLARMPSKVSCCLRLLHLLHLPRLSMVPVALLHAPWWLLAPFIVSMFFLF